jgi:hypothetical protein
MSDDRSGSRLPPPAFPPGSRKHITNNSSGHVDSSDLGGAFISPDDPIPERDHSVEDAIISPDDPIPARVDSVVDATTPSGSSGAFISPDEPIPPRDTVSTGPGGVPQFETEGGVVTGIGMDDHTDADELASAGDPYVIELVEKVGKLAEALRSKGEAGLRSAPGMDKFETTLRGYCVGYLAGPTRRGRRQYGLLDHDEAGGRVRCEPGDKE